MKSLLTTGLPQLLVTDDDPALRQVVAEGMGRRGFQVTQARNGREAIEVVGRCSVHVALVDLHMPEVNGLELIRYLTEPSPVRAFPSALQMDTSPKTSVASSLNSSKPSPSKSTR